MASRTVQVGDKSFQVERMNFAVLRSLEKHEDTYGDLLAEVDGLDTQIGSVQSQLMELASEGVGTPDKVDPLVALEKDLGKRRRSVGLRQLEVRLEILAAKLVDATAEELGELVDFTGDELARLEDEVSSPPTTAREGATS